jgi:hypothetical protein
MKNAAAIVAWWALGGIGVPITSAQPATPSGSASPCERR